MLDNVSDNNPIKINKQRYTMSSLNVKADSRAASIFNKIDMSDGTRDNSLSQDQVNEFRKEYLGNMPQDELKSAIGNKAFEKLSKSYLQQFVNEDGTYNLNSFSNAVLNAISQDYKIENNNDETELIRKTLKELTGVEFSSKETSRILDLLGFKKQSPLTF